MRFAAWSAWASTLLNETTWQRASLVAGVLALPVSIYAAWPASTKEADLRAAANISPSTSFYVAVKNNGEGTAIIDSVTATCSLGGGDPLITCGLGYNWLKYNAIPKGTRIKEGNAKNIISVDHNLLNGDKKLNESLDQISKNILHISINVTYHDETGESYSVVWSGKTAG